jgi:hypothetical protein
MALLSPLRSGLFSMTVQSKAVGMALRRGLLSQSLGRNELLFFLLLDLSGMRSLIDLLLLVRSLSLEWCHPISLNLR